MRRLLTLGLVLALIPGALGWLNVTRQLPALSPAAAGGQCTVFADLAADHPACDAIAALVAAGVIAGYASAPPTFGPSDPVLRAQVAAFLVRALGWAGRTTGPRTFTDFGALTAELLAASLILANACDAAEACVARGYDPATCAVRGLIAPCFGPNDEVTYAQAISFVTRAFRLDARRAWQPQPGGVLPYQGVPSVHQDDVRTYYAYAGAIPAAPTDASGWSDPAPRAWVARVLFQALNPPATSPAPSPSAAPAPGASAMPSASASASASASPGQSSSPSPSPGVPGNGALAFDGLNDEARGGQLVGTADNQTVECWFRPSADRQTSLILVNSDDTFGWIVELYEGQFRFWMADIGGTWRPVTLWNTFLAANTWHHLAVTYDAGSKVAQLFLNGTLGASAALGQLSQGPYFRVGGLTPHPFAAGQLDEVRISRAIRYTGAFTPASTAFAPDADTIALYHFDEQTGQILVDASGNGNTLILGTTAGSDGADPARIASTAPTGSTAALP